MGVTEEQNAEEPQSPTKHMDLVSTYIEIYRNSWKFSSLN